ncbi:hypothetical protein AB1N83_013858 [Pleurotus pulmonarius]
MAICKSSRKEHSPSTRNRFIGAVLGGASLRKAALIASIPFGTGASIYKKYQLTGSTANQPRTGRPTKVSDASKRLLIRNALKSRRAPFSELANHMTPPVSTSTVRNILNEAGYHRRVARKVPYLTTAHRQKRKDWGERFKVWDEKKWRWVIFSDESYIQLDKKAGRIYITRRAGEELQENCLVPTFKQSSIRVMVWGCIMFGHKGPLIVLEYPGGRNNSMNSVHYQDQVLDGTLIPFYASLKPLKKKIWFQQDNAPSHSSKSTQAWFSDHRIPLLPHPPNSPDMNPIEAIWHELKARLRALPHLPTTTKQLKEAVLCIWEELPMELINKYIQSMPMRVQSLVNAKGGHTGF